jgi:tight adherence protein B
VDPEVRLRLGIALAAALAAFGALTSAGAAAPPLQLTESGGASFPARAYLATLAGGLRLEASRVSVRENNHRVVGLRVVPANTAGGASFGTVLVMDASDSMRGAPITSAVNAARAFVAKRNLNQRLAILTFNASTDVALPFTTSQSAIEQALAREPQLRYGTHIYDGVAQGVALLRAAGISAGAVIVLSDGADTGSTIALDTVAKNARDAHVRVFTVGLGSVNFHPGPLQQLAQTTGGTFLRARSLSDLAPIFSELGLQLARQYLITYNSIAEPGRHVQVEVSVSGIGRATTGYVSPALPVAGGFHRSRAEGIWQSWVTMLFIALLVPALLGVAIVLAAGRRGSTVRARVSDYVTMPQKQEGEALASRIFVGTERSLERTRWWSRFKQTLELADIKIPPVQIVVATLVLTLFAMWLFSRAAGVLALVGLAVPFLVRGLILGKLKRKRRIFGEQLPDNLDVLASGLRAGHSLVGALAVVVNNSPEPSRTEFQRVIADEQLGIPLADALGVVVKRMKSRDLEQVALVASVQGETGGNAAEVLDRVTESIRERAELRRIVRTLTAQGRLARWVVSALPVGLLIVVSLLNPDYMKPLFTHTSGRIALVVAALMVTGGSVVIGRIVDIEV